MNRIKKYPRTSHLQGSRLQAGDHDLRQVPVAELKDCHVVVEEKVDGANVGISFEGRGALLLQSRGHFLSGGPREKHFALFKTWAHCQQTALWDILGKRYQMYGEWLYAKHTVYYDQLPHYFMEFDIYDREQDLWLDTATRHRLLEGSPVVSVPVLAAGLGQQLLPVTQWLKGSLYRSTDWVASLEAQATRLGLDPVRALSETYQGSLAEGLYFKLEADGKTHGRLKWVNHQFLNSILDSGSHWLNRPIIPNELKPGLSLFD